MIDNHELVLALRRRDPDAFAALFEAYSDRIFHLALGILKNEAEAEGVVQDTFLTLFEKLNQFEGRAKLSTWLYRVAYNLSIDRLRKKRPVEPLTDENTYPNDATFMPAIFTDWRRTPEARFATAEARAELDKAIAALPQRLQTTFILRELEGLSTAETASVLGINPGTVKVQLHRARLLLREHLAAYFQERLSATEKA